MNQKKKKKKKKNLGFGLQDWKELNLSRSTRLEMSQHWENLCLQQQQ